MYPRALFKSVPFVSVNEDERSPFHNGAAPPYMTTRCEDLLKNFGTNMCLHVWVSTARDGRTYLMDDQERVVDGETSFIEHLQENIEELRDMGLLEYALVCRTRAYTSGKTCLKIYFVWAGLSQIRWGQVLNWLGIEDILRAKGISARPFNRWGDHAGCKDYLINDARTVSYVETQSARMDMYLDTK